MNWAILDEKNIVVSMLKQPTRPPNAVAIEDGVDCRLGLEWTGWGFRPQVFTSYQFLLRFTESELELVRSRAVSDGIVWRFLTLATGAQEIDSGDPMTIAGMDYLVQIAVLTAARRDQILAA